MYGRGAVILHHDAGGGNHRAKPEKNGRGDVGNGFDAFTPYGTGRHHNEKPRDHNEGRKEPVISLSRHPDEPFQKITHSVPVPHGTKNEFRHCVSPYS